MPYYVDGGKLRALRYRNDLAQRDLAEEAGVAMNTVPNAEKRLTGEALYGEKLAWVLFVEPGR